MNTNFKPGALSVSMLSLLLAVSLTSCSGGTSTSEDARDQSGATVIKFGINVANPEKQEPATYAIVQN